MVLSSTLPHIILFDHTMKEETSISGVQGSVQSSRQPPPPPQEWGLETSILSIQDSVQRCRQPPVSLGVGDWGCSVAVWFQQRGRLLKDISSSWPSPPKQWSSGSILQGKPPGSHCVPVISQDRTELLVSIDVFISHRASRTSLTTSSCDQMASLSEPPPP